MTVKFALFACIAALSATAACADDGPTVETEGKLRRVSIFVHADSAKGTNGVDTSFTTPLTWTAKSTGEGFFLATPNGTGVDYPATVVNYGAEENVRNYHAVKYTFRCADQAQVTVCAVMNTSEFVIGPKDYGRFQINSFAPADADDVAAMLESFEGESFFPY